MSEKCNCMWCKKNVNAEEATSKRISFLHKIFELAFSKKIAQGNKPIDAILEEFKIELIEFFKKEDQFSSDLMESIFNITFYYTGMPDEIKPWEINLLANEVHDCIVKGFEFLKSDIGIAETPVLSGLVTPEMVVNCQLDGTEFPQEVIALYMKQHTNSMSSLLSGLQESYGVQVEIPERSTQTVH